MNDLTSESEIIFLKQKIEQINQENKDAASQGLKLLEENARLQKKLEEKELENHISKEELSKAQENISNLNKRLISLENCSEEERFEREKELENIIQSNLKEKEKTLKLQNNVRLLSKEKETLETLIVNLNDQFELSKNEIEIFKTKLQNHEKKDFEFLKEISSLEDDNWKLEEQVNNLMKKRESFEKLKVEYELLKEEEEATKKYNVEFTNKIKNLEKLLENNYEDLENERKMRFDLSKEKKYNSFISSFHQSTHQSIMSYDFSIDNITMLLSHLSDNEEEDEQKNNLNCSEKELSRNELKKMKKSLMNELMESCEEIVSSEINTFEENQKKNNDLKEENNKLKLFISQNLTNLSSHLDSPTEKTLISDLDLTSFYQNLSLDLDENPTSDNDSLEEETIVTCLTKQYKPQSMQTSPILIHSSSSIIPFSNKFLTNLPSHLSSIKEQLVQMTKLLVASYQSICFVAEEKVNSVAMENIEMRLKSFIEQIENKKTFVKEEEEQEVIDIFDLIGSGYDLVKYQSRVVQRMMDMKQRSEELKMSVSLNGNFQASYLVSMETNTQLQVMLERKINQINVMREAINSNRSTYEKNLNDIQTFALREIEERRRRESELRKEVEELRILVEELRSMERKHKNIQLDLSDANQKLEASYLETQTLNALLALAIRHKLKLISILQNNAIPFQLYDNPHKTESLNINNKNDLNNLDENTKNKTKKIELANRRIFSTRLPPRRSHLATMTTTESSKSKFQPLLYKAKNKN